MKLAAHVGDPRRRHAMAVRARVERGIREFFDGRGFAETRTPVWVPNPGMEPHIRPVAVAGGGYLQTSPELAMKRLLVGGLERIYQLCPVFRDEPPSATHQPEFTMLEWYRAGADEHAIMEDVEELFAALAGEGVAWRGGRVGFDRPWPRLAVPELMARFAGVDVGASDFVAECRRAGMTVRGDEPWDDLFFQLWLDHVEPALPADRAVFVTSWPERLAALSVVENGLARRFEVFAGGLELANAFYELTDPVEQRRRFVADMELRARRYGAEFPPTPLPEEFLAALDEGLPPSAGIALGVDRLVMLLAGEPDIAYTMWWPRTPS